MEIAAGFIVLTIILLIIGVCLLIIGVRKGSTTNINYTGEIIVNKPHTVSIVSNWGVFLDRFNVLIDGKTVFTQSVDAIFRAVGSEILIIDNEPVQIRWRWNRVWGNPIYILLEHDGIVLSHYGDETKVKQLNVRITQSELQQKRLVQSKLGKEIVTSEHKQEFAIDDYPIDNRHGSDAISIEQEVSKTSSTNITCEDKELSKLGVSASILKVLTGQISTEISKRLHVSFGETVVKRHMMKFSVKPGDSVVYEVIWKNKLRSGKFLAYVDNQEVSIPYEACYGLIFELNSKRLEGPA